MGILGRGMGLEEDSEVSVGVVSVRGLHVIHGAQEGGPGTVSCNRSSACESS